MTSHRLPGSGKAGPIAAITVSVVIIATVAVWIYKSPASCEPNGPLTDVHGIIGSEKVPFFEDQQVQRELACAGLTVTVDPAGSREIAGELDRGYDFAFPSSTPTAEKIMRERGISESFAPFSSPMAVATFRPIVDVLTRVGIIRPASPSDQTPVVDIKKLLDAARAGTRWDQLAGNTEYPVRRSVLINTTDPQDSNSAIMYLSLASYVANDFNVVRNQGEVRRVLPDMCRIFIDQGNKPPTSQVLYNYYVNDGMGRIPLALIYEAQYENTKQPTDHTSDQVLLYPSPTVYARHTLVPLNEAGRRVGQALVDDPELARLAAEYGFRPEKPTDLPISHKPKPIDVVESPSFEMLESMLNALAPDPVSGEPCAGIQR